MADGHHGGALTHPKRLTRLRGPRPLNVSGWVGGTGVGASGFRIPGMSGGGTGAVQSLPVLVDSIGETLVWINDHKRVFKWIELAHLSKTHTD